MNESKETEMAHGKKKKILIFSKVKEQLRKKLTQR